MSDIILHILRPSSLKRKWVVKGEIKNIIEDEDDDKYTIVMRKNKYFRLIYWNLYEYVVIKRNKIKQELDDTDDYHGNYYINDIVNDWFRAQGKALPTKIHVLHGFDSFILWKDQLSFPEYFEDVIHINDKISYEIMDSYLEVRHNENRNTVVVTVKHKLVMSNGIQTYDDDKVLLKDLKYYPKCIAEEKDAEVTSTIDLDVSTDDLLSPHYGCIKYDKGVLTAVHKRKCDLINLSKINKKFKVDHENEDVANSLEECEDE